MCYKESPKTNAQRGTAEDEGDETSHVEEGASTVPADTTTSDLPPASELAKAAAVAVEVTDAEPAGEKEGTAASGDTTPSFTMGLSSTAADEEAKKRTDRAKRFGLEEDDDAKKRAERASRFGLDDKELASGLDSALPERPLKRGRGRDAAAHDSNRPGTRQSLDRRGGNRRVGNNRRDGQDHERGGGGGGQQQQTKRASVMDDPAEKAKAEKRAARFAAA